MEIKISILLPVLVSRIIRGTEGPVDFVGTEGSADFADMVDLAGTVDFADMVDLVETVDLPKYASTQPGWAIRRKRG